MRHEGTVQIEGPHYESIAADAPDEFGLTYLRVILRDDQIDLIAEAVVKKLAQHALEKKETP